jgi:hypothetical protein
MEGVGMARRVEHVGAVTVLAAAVAVAVVSARDFAGGWNDGSRLATVESLVDHGTFAIDQSIFVQVPPEHNPYPPDEPALLALGTADKLWIGGHYYSDKSPLPAVLMAGVYAVVQRLSGLTAHVGPRVFCYLMTVTTSGLAYVVAVWCVYQLTGALGLSLGIRLLIASSFALSTVAPAYARHVNNHILLLAVAAALQLMAIRLAQRTSAGQRCHALLLAIGTLAGLGYTIDLAAGPILLVGVFGLAAHRCRTRLALALMLLAAAALPWIVLHHALNYHIAGTLRPANALPQNLAWPGSPFNATNMTGFWHHSGTGHFLTYAAALFLGKRGFLGHNLPLFLGLLAALPLLRARVHHAPELVFALCWSAATWLVYSLASTNSSGACLTVRWFVPLLAPGFLVLALVIDQYPRFAADLALLSAWGAALAALMWWHGPWVRHMVPLFWPIQAAALLCWALYARRRRNALMLTPNLEEMRGRRAA